MIPCKVCGKPVTSRNGTWVATMAGGTRGPYCSLACADRVEDAAADAVPLQTLEGEQLPLHACDGPRSERGKALARVFAQWDRDRGTWHPQLALSSPGGAQVIGILHCPFCGVRLKPEHFR